MILSFILVKYATGVTLISNLLSMVCNFKVLICFGELPYISPEIISFIPGTPTLIVI